MSFMELQSGLMSSASDAEKTVVTQIVLEDGGVIPKMSFYGILGA